MHRLASGGRLRGNPHRSTTVPAEAANRNAVEVSLTLTNDSKHCIVAAIRVCVICSGTARVERSNRQGVDVGFDCKICQQNSPDFGSSWTHGCWQKCRRRQVMTAR